MKWTPRAALGAGAGARPTAGSGARAGARAGVGGSAERDVRRRRRVRGRFGHSLDLRGLRGRDRRGFAAGPSRDGWADGGFDDGLEAAGEADVDYDDGLAEEDDDVF